MTGLWRLRAAVLALVGALGVHHGRYLFATPEHEHGLAAVHRYLTYLTPIAAALLFLGAVQLAVGVRRGGGTARRPRGRTLWAAATACLLAVFAGQECAETLLAHGHLPTPAELLGAGGWVAVPLALAIGGIVALLLRGAARVARWALGRTRARATRRSPRIAAPAAVVLIPRASVLARRLAGRAPPALS